MNTEQIKMLLAHQFVQQMKSSLLNRNADETEASKSFRDKALQGQSAGFLRQLEALKEADQNNIYEAFSYFGPSQISRYIQTSLTTYRTNDAFFRACVKLGNLALSEEEISAQVQNADSMLRQNPHIVIERPYRKQMDDAAKAFYDGKITAGELPYITDRLYLNAIRATETESGEGLFQNSARLFEYAFEQYRQAKGNLAVDQELQLAGIVVLACRCLPEDYKINHTAWEETSVLDILKANRKSVANFKELEDLLPPIDKLIKEVKELEQQHEMLAYPVKMARKIYDHDFEQKVRACLTPSIAHDFQPDALEM